MSPLEAVVTRSARPKTGAASGKALVVAPFADAAFDVSPGGDGVGTREYDPGRHDSGREAIDAPLDLTFRQGTIMAASDALAKIVLPTVDTGDPPVWISTRGHEARAYDRRHDREVYGPHWFDEPSDIIVTNGVIRFWVVAGGYLAVDAVNDGAWHHVGYLPVTAGEFTSARLVSISRDGVLVTLTDGTTTVRAECRRGERMIRLSDAVGLAWKNEPESMQRYGLTSVAGQFGKAAAFADVDLIELAWPVTKATWAFAGWWIPDDNSATQADCGIWYATDDTPALVSTLFYRDGALEWTQDGDTLTSAPLTFDAGEPVFVALSYTAAVRRLSVKVESGAISHVTDVVDTGTAEDNFTSFVLAPMFGDLGGYSDTYSDTYDLAGVGTWAFDNVMVFGEGLTADEAATLSAATTGLGGLPEAESRLAWYLHFDDPADSGLTRGVVTVGDDQGAYLALAGATYDDVADHEAQFSAEFEQQIRVR